MAVAPHICAMNWSKAPLQSLANKSGLVNSSDQDASVMELLDSMFCLISWSSG
jgi:hypothetical protein